MARPDGIREDVWRAVRSARLWRSASDADVEWLARVAQVHDFDKGELLFPEGQCPIEVAVVLDGHARGVSLAEGRPVVVETYWPGDVIGALSALGSVPLEANVEASEGMSAAFIPVGTLKDLLATEPSVALSVINELARRWVDVVNASKRNSTGVISRVATYLSDLPRTRLGGPAYAVEIPVSRVELAGLLGTTPETLSRAFHTLQTDGLIESHDRMIIVPDGDSLLGRNDDERDRVIPAGVGGR
jgi:CRP/FNR family transcriptional regulator